MPLFFPFAAGLIAGVCVAPTVRKQRKLRKVFKVVDTAQQHLKETGWLGAHAFNRFVGGDVIPPRLYDPSRGA